MKKNIFKNTLLYIALFGMLLYPKTSDSVSKTVTVNHNQKREIEYKPSSKRRIYVFHDYRTPIPYDNAKFTTISDGYDKSKVEIKYASRENGSFRYERDSGSDGDRSYASVNPKYDFFRSGSYGYSNGSGNVFRINVR